MTTCPANRYKEVKQLEPGDVLILDWDQEVPEGYVVTHYKKRGRYAVPERKGEYELLLVGSAQEWRIRRHYGAEGRWVGQCTYAFWVKKA
ncbi:hypothetical protein CSW47_08385 [Thermus scotoductus]|uniref:Uncharacterized protein n=1 Tax=Thermus scotoductus TaxID=37636 RepID=A0A430R8D6_THESC|nr:hypothetical protein CSW47_08385 [Thermus scotoductus]